MSKGDDEISFATNKKHTVKFKIVFIGDQAVGKTSVINRFIKNEFDGAHNPTVGIDFVSKNVLINDKSIRLQLWDTAGQERFRSLIPGYLRDSHAIFLVYDITNADSYQNINMWLDYIKDNRGEDVCIFIIGNKIDQKEDRAVSQQQARERFSQRDAHFIEVSAKSGENLENLFINACKELLKAGEFQTTATQIQPLKKKSMQIITGEKEKPNIKATKENAEKQVQDPKQMRGTKLEKNEQQKGRFVQEKNCC